MATINIKMAATELGYTEFHTKELVRKDKLPAQKELVPGTKANWRWMVEEDDISAFISARGESTRAFGARQDGRNKFVAWFTPEEMEAFKTQFPELPEPKRANKPSVKKE